MVDVVRTFIAVELPPDVRAALSDAQHALQQTDAVAARAVKWVTPASIHLTLKFLGDTPTRQLDAIRADLGEATAGRPPIALSLTGAGCFPNLRQPRVLWIGVGGDLGALSSVQAALEAAISPLGFPTESRAFSPHLTLGRVRDDAGPEIRQRLGDTVKALRPHAVAFVVTGVSLMRSELGPGGAVYTQIAHHSFSSTSA